MYMYRHIYIYIYIHVYVERLQYCSGAAIKKHVEFDVYFMEIVKECVSKSLVCVVLLTRHWVDFDSVALRIPPGQIEGAPWNAPWAR